jgi:hypothetical protein
MNKKNKQEITKLANNTQNKNKNDILHNTQKTEKTTKILKHINSEIIASNHGTK